MNLAKNIVYLRKLKEISQQQLANELNVKRYSIADWEQGRAEPSINYLIQLASFFNVSIDYLINNNNYYRHSKHDIIIIKALERKQCLLN